MPSLAFPLAGPLGAGADTTPTTTGVAIGLRGRDLTFDPVTGDLAVVGGDLTMVSAGAAIAQEVNIRLQFLLSEWFLDITQGVPYLQVVLVKSPTLAAVKSVLRDEILSSAGIDTITKLDLAFDQATRTLAVTWAATTNLGALITDQEVTI